MHLNKKKILLSLIFLLLVALNMNPVPVSACSCEMPPTADIALDNADAVFSGEVVSINEHIKESGYVVKFNVQRVWKGLNTKTVSIYTASNSAACGVNFSIGEEYLVYTHRYEETSDAMLTTTVCDRTASVANISDDLALIGKGDIPTKIEANDEPRNNNIYYFGILTIILTGSLFIWRYIKKPT